MSHVTFEIIKKKYIVTARKYDNTREKTNKKK